MAKSLARQNKRQNSTTNVDTKNLRILEAELRNLELGKDTHTPKERRRYNELKLEIARIKNSGKSGGNPNTQKRPKESRSWRL